MALRLWIYTERSLSDRTRGSRRLEEKSTAGQPEIYNVHPTTKTFPSGTVSRHESTVVSSWRNWIFCALSGRAALNAHSIIEAGQRFESWIAKLMFETRTSDKNNPLRYVESRTRNALWYVKLFGILSTKPWFAVRRLPPSKVILEE